jgi:hypothetical protein
LLQLVKLVVTLEGMQYDVVELVALMALMALMVVV